MQQGVRKGERFCKLIAHSVHTLHSCAFFRSECITNVGFSRAEKQEAEPPHPTILFSFLQHPPGRCHQADGREQAAVGPCPRHRPGCWWALCCTNRGWMPPSSLGGWWQRGDSRDGQALSCRGHPEGVGASLGERVVTAANGKSKQNTAGKLIL